jgi:hypothetical protein
MSVPIEGPDGKTYEFPDGTDKAGAVAYFKKNNITAPKEEIKTGSFGDTLGNMWEHAKGLVTGPIQAFGAPPQNQEEAIVSGMPGVNIPGGLGVYRMFVEPSLNALREAFQLRAQGGPQASILHGSSWDPQTHERIPTAGSKLVDAIPIYGPWAAQGEQEVHQKGVAPAVAGLATDIAGGELMSRAPGAGKKFVGGVARKGAQTLLSVGGDLTRRAVEAENARVANRQQFVADADAELKKQFLDKADVSMKEDQGMLTEHEAKMRGLDENHRNAQKEHQENLRAMHDRNLERGKQNQLAETERQNKNAEKIGEYHRKVNEIKDQNARDLAEHQAAQKKAQADWDELNKAHSQGQEAIASRDVMEKQVQDDLKTLEKKVNLEANAKYNDLRAKMKDTFIPQTDAAAAVQKAYEWVRGSPETIKQFKFISDMEKQPAVLKWNDLQGYLEEFRRKLNAGGMDSDTYKAVESMHDYIEGEMGKLAKENGTAAEWADAQASWANYKQTFHDSGSPVAKAIDARTSDVAARGFMGHKVMIEDPALAQLRVYDQGLFNRIQRLREVSGAAADAPKKAPGPLAGKEPPAPKNPEDVPLPKTDDEPIPYDRGFESPEDFKPLAPKGTAKAPRAKPFKSPVGKKFEEQVIDAPELKKEKIRDTARRLSEAKDGDAFLATSPAAPFVLAKKLVAARLDRPAVLNWLAKPSALDLEALKNLSPEAEARARARIDEYVKAQPAPVKLDPAIRAFIGAGAVTGSAEQRAREATQRLQGQGQDQGMELAAP